MYKKTLITWRNTGKCEFHLWFRPRDPQADLKLIDVSHDPLEITQLQIEIESA